MKNLINFLFLGIMSCHNWAFAQNEFAVSNIPDSLRTGASAVVRLDESSLHIKNTGSAVLTARLVVTFFEKPSNSDLVAGGPEGKFYSTDNLQGKIYNAKGEETYKSEKSEVSKFGSFDTQEFDDTKTKALSLDPIELPFTVEFSSRIKFDNFVSMSSSSIQRFGRSVQNYKFTVECPDDFKFKWKAFNIGRKDLLDSHNPESNKWTWEAQNLKAVPSESYSPYLSDTYSYIAFAPDNFDFGTYKGSMRDWKSYGKFMYDLNFGRDNLSPQMTEKVVEMTKNTQNDKEKIEILYKYLQETNRYVSIQIGVGGWQTLEAEFVEKKKYGDCKALSNYMRAMLKAAGIKSYLTAIRGDYDGCPEVGEDLVENHFNHVILYVPDSDIWLECTSQNDPVGYVGGFTCDRAALVYTPEGGKLMRTPAYSYLDNTKTSHTSLTLGEDGSAKLTNNIDYTGLMHDWYRTLSFQYSGEELKKEFTKRSPFNISLLHDFSILTDKKAPKANVKYEATVGSFANKTGKRMFVPLFKTSPTDRTLSKKEKRTHRIVMRDAETMEDFIDLQIPTGFAPESVPENKTLKSEFGTCDFSIEIQGSKAAIHRKTVFFKVDQPASRYEEIRSFLADVDKISKMQLVLVKNQ